MIGAVGCAAALTGAGTEGAASTVPPDGATMTAVTARTVRNRLIRIMPFTVPGGRAPPHRPGDGNGIRPWA
ncbi:hypothetical protein GCM10010109_20380 [Actinoplanes campanulatus]|nr:hypothetical protein GCM10010109_20380 [Actinoplanes campanulatus]